MPTHLKAHFDAGRHIPGLLLVRRGTSIGALVQALHLIWSVSSAEEYADQRLFIPL